MKPPLPTTDDDWLREIALAWRDAAGAKEYGLLTLGRPVRKKEYFHLAPHICLKIRGVKATPTERAEVVEGAVGSVIVTMEQGEGGPYLKRSPLLAFAFCYLAAHFVADLMGHARVTRLMDMCLARKADLARLVKAGTLKSR